ncbi:N-acetylmuramoyl-L-alanine amidase [Patescibacteria group bacterium]|nr:N-acetylmuramoyl-L-alanine amidase [Patescibacteria group bacterium]
MKIKKEFIKGVVAALCASLVFSLCPLIPAVSAKEVFKTLSFDEKLETKQDFIKGKLDNLEIKEKDRGVEISSLNGKEGVYISPVIKAPFEALHIGLRWNEELFDGSLINAYVRTGNDGENFSQWVKAEAERNGGRDDVFQEETFISLVGTKKAAFAQVKMEFIPGKGVSPKLKNLAVVLLNSEEEFGQAAKKLSFVPRSTASSVGAEKISPNGQSINVISREDWKANEDYRFSADGTTESWPRSYHGTRKLIIHHTADVNSNGQTDLEINKATVRSIYFYHAVTLGWGDIGYNALVDAAGNIYEGRYGTHDAILRTNPSANQIMELDIEAGHSRSYNSGSFGVSALGDFTAFVAPNAQLSAIENVLAFVADSRGIVPQGKSDFLRYDGAWHYDLHNIIAHRDVNATACPGESLYSQLDRIKNDITNASIMLPNIALSASANTILTESGNAGGDNIGTGTITFNWLFSGVAQYQYALEKVTGITGVTGEPWETAWLNPENPNIITGISTSFSLNNLDDKSNYVFYVRALDANGTAISSVSHVNFVKDENNIIVDNLSDRYTGVAGEWTHSTNVSGFYAEDYQTNAAGSGKDTFAWKPNIFKEGNYDVFVWYTAAADRSIRAPYTVFYQDASGKNYEKTILINQKTNGGKWVSLGAFYFTTGGVAKVQLSDNIKSGYVIADAVKFTLKP